MVKFSQTSFTVYLYQDFFGRGIDANVRILYLTEILLLGYFTWQLFWQIFLIHCILFSFLTFIFKKIYICKNFKKITVVFLIQTVFLEAVFQYIHFWTKIVILLSEENNVNPLLHNAHWKVIYKQAFSF